MDAIAADIERLRGRIAALNAQQQLGAVLESEVADAELLLTRFRND